MKTKKQLTIIILITCLLVSGIVYGEAPVKGSGNEAYTGSVGGLGWQERTIRTSVFVSDGVKVTVGFTITITGPGLTINLGSNFDIIECCKATSVKESWCNFNADDTRCED
jgi:hypothetical protein